MNIKSKRLFARKRTELGNYAPRRITHQSFSINHFNYVLQLLVTHRKYTQHNLFMQFLKMHKQNELDSWKKFLAQKSVFEPWMLVTDDEVSANIILFSLLYVKIRKTLYGFFFSLAFLFLFSLTSIDIKAQIVPVTGRVVASGVPKPGFDVRVYTSESGVNPRIDKGVSDSNGRFRILSGITDVRDGNFTPNDYSFSPPYPNPSSGISSVQFSVPTQDNISLKVYDILGRECLTRSAVVGSGVWAADIDISKFASGMYIISFFSNNKFVGSSKILLDKSAVGKANYSTSLTKVGALPFVLPDKPAAVRFVDSVVASGPGYKSTVLRNVGPLVGDSVDVGDVAMFTGLANANVLVYDLKFFRQKELHPIAGAVVRLGLDSVVTDANGRGTFIVPATNVPYPVKITHPSMFTRETKVVVDGDKSLEFDVLTHSSYPDSVYNFIQKNFGVNGGTVIGLPFVSARWIKQPEFIFKTDTTLASPNPQIQSWMQLINFNLGKLDTFMVPVSENPRNPHGFLKDYQWTIDKDAWIYDTTSGLHNNGKFMIYWDDSVSIKYGGLAFTAVYLNYVSGEIFAAQTKYDSYKFFPPVPSVWRNIDAGVIHELDTGIYKTGRDTSIQSVSNRGPPYEFRNYTENDKLIRPYLLSRPPGTVAPDKDNGWHEFEKSSNKPSNLMAMYSFTMADGRVIKYNENIDNNYRGLTDAKIREIIQKAR